MQSVEQKAQLAELVRPCLLALPQLLFKMAAQQMHLCHHKVWGTPLGHQDHVVRVQAPGQSRELQLARMDRSGQVRPLEQLPLAT